MSAAIAVAVVAAGVLMAGGKMLTVIDGWYRALRKSRAQPPDWAFGPAWALVLTLAAVSAVLGWQAADEAGRAVMAVAFAANWVLNLLWSPLFFKARRPDWALGDVMLLWASVALMIVVLAPWSPVAAALLVPYLAWVGFAAWLNLAIVRLNPPFA